ncbi:MAG: hypothetical protein RLZZ338_2717 [Cyanobacteriota bacterium]|jgi:hypothetical protein
MGSYRKTIVPFFSGINYKIFPIERQGRGLQQFVKNLGKSLRFSGKIITSKATIKPNQFGVIYRFGWPRKYF